MNARVRLMILINMVKYFFSSCTCSHCPPIATTDESDVWHDIPQAMRVMEEDLVKPCIIEPNGFVCVCA